MSDCDRPRSQIVAALATACLLLACCSLSAAQPDDNNTRPATPANWDFDFDLFETLLQSRELTSRNEAFATVRRRHWDRVFSDPSESVMIFTGNLPSGADWRTCHRFLSRGGMMLIATNQPLSLRGFFRIEFGPAVTADRRISWQGHEDCLQVSDISSSSSLTNNVTTIITNRSGWIAELERSLDYRWTPIARLPRSLQPPESRQQPLAALATARNRSGGRLIVFADESPLSNGMLWHGDNLALLINVVQELTRDGRKHYAFLHNGQPVKNRVTEMLIQETIRQQQKQATIPPEALADLPAEALLEIGNTVVTSIEDSDILNELATDRPRTLAPRFYRRAILLALCCAAVAIFLIRSWLGGQIMLPWWRKRRPPEVAEQPALLSGMQYDQASRALARDTCRLLTDSADPADWQNQLRPDSPVWRQLYARSQAPRRTAETVARILLCSTDAPETRMSQKEFERFGEAIYELKQLHEPEATADSGLAWT